MPNPIHLQLTEEFQIACIMHQLNPVEVLQGFIDSMVLPCGRLTSAPECILASNYLVAYTNIKPVSIFYTDRQKEFLQLKENQLIKLLKISVRHPEPERAEAIRCFFRLWLKEWRAEYQHDRPMLLSETKQVCRH